MPKSSNKVKKMPRKYKGESWLSYAERLARVGIRYKIVGQRRTA